MCKIASEISKKVANRLPELKNSLEKAELLADAMVGCFRNNGTFFVAGNGGSGADAEHICGELLKGFLRKRPLAAADQQQFQQLFGEDGAKTAAQLQGGLKAVSLLSHPALTSAFGNDVNPLLAFAQQLWALGNKGDVFLAISTSGNAENLRLALMAARVKGIKTALLTGNRHGICEKYADIVIDVPEKETYLIQEYHLPVYHAVCQMVEAQFWEE